MLSIAPYFVVTVDATQLLNSNISAPSCSSCCVTGVSSANNKRLITAPMNASPAPVVSIALTVNPRDRYVYHFSNRWTHH